MSIKDKLFLFAGFCLFIIILVLLAVSGFAKITAIVAFIFFAASLSFITLFGDHND